MPATAMDPHRRAQHGEAGARPGGNSSGALRDLVFDKDATGHIPLLRVAPTEQQFFKHIFFMFSLGPSLRWRFKLLPLSAATASAAENDFCSLGHAPGAGFGRYGERHR